ncbi:retinaldehyde-binding protein 1 [Caerostris darwini]|uniref:Retinaldehyde-binding protein 1 n=1 Tax=Caerostris darwini TaxID=1538125 RepID=A0AAV4RJG2_9ARAC|nr:retinaldehyde-binding protein 1 [Caerostris darwini]
MSSVNQHSEKPEEPVLPFEIDYLPEFARRKLEVELKETPENREKALAELKKLTSADKATSDYNFEEDLLIQYLRHSKYDVSRAINHIRNYVILRKKNLRLFQSIPDEYFQSKVSTQFVMPLPKRSPDGCTIVLTRTGMWDPREMAYNDLVRLSMMTFLQFLRDPMTQVNGFKVIHDFQGTSLQHYRYCTPYNLHFLFYATVDCIPARYAEIHFINESFVLRAVWALTKNFLSEKIRNRVYFHKNVEELHQFFPRSVLPVEYGGELQDINTNWSRRANKEHETNDMEGQPNKY